MNNIRSVEKGNWLELFKASDHITDFDSVVREYDGFLGRFFKGRTFGM